MEDGSITLDPTEDAQEFGGRALPAPWMDADPPELQYGAEDSLADAALDASLEAPADPAALRVRMKFLRIVVKAAAERLPADAVDRALDAAGLDARALAFGSGWVDGASTIALLATLRDAVPNDDDFRRLCRGRLRDAVGPIAALVPTAHPATFWRLAARTVPLVARGVRIEVREAVAVAARIRVHIDGPEDPAWQLFRDELLQEATRLGGLPRGELVPLRRIADGAPYDELVLRYPLTHSSTRIIIGAIAGVGAAAALGIGGIVGPVGMLAVALLGVTLPVAAARLVGMPASDQFLEEVSRSLTQLDAETSHVVAELWAMRDRERAWASRLQQATDRRAADAQSRMDRLEALLDAQRDTVRGFSHDLRNPLVVMNVAPDLVREHLRERGIEAPELDRLLDDQLDAVDRVRALLGGLIEAVRDPAPAVPLHTERVQVDELAERIGARLRAVTWGSRLTTEVRADAAPAAIDTDLVVLDRIIDNLVTNAAKYTPEGHIRAQLGAAPGGGLRIEIADSGRGIARCDQERIFRAGGSTETARAQHSYGLGLSVVVQLLDQLGGTLSLHSVPGVGSRFTVDLPAEPAPGAGARLADPPDVRLARVVRLREPELRPRP